MKRALLLLLFAANAFAADPKWLENYNKGVAAVNAGRHAEGASLLAKAIAERPMEGTELKISLTVVAAYTPHFWLGIAKFNLGDVDGALREWRISEEQGAIARTPYYSRLKDWVARAQTEKQLQAEKAASGAKKAANAAIGNAVQLQVEALNAGGDRTEAYRDAQRKLQDAQARFRQAGTSSAAYESVAETAEQAAQAFTAAAEEGKRIRLAAANRPKPVQVQPAPAPVQQQQPAPVQPTPVQQQPKPAEREILFDQEPVAKPAPKTETVAPPQPQKQAQPQPLPQPPTANRQPSTITAPTATPAPKPIDVTAAYRAFATGDLATAERLLDRMLAATPAAEAYLLRGCVRYTRAMLSRTPEPLLLAATDDFRAALDRNRALRLDRRVFSPKLVAHFEQVRGRR